MPTMLEKEFMKIVEREVSQRPRMLGVLFKYISDNWNKMVDTQRNERESSHLHALGMMLDNLWALHMHGKKNPRLFSNMECCTILDAVDAVDPECTGGSPARRDLLRLLADSFRALDWTPECSFIKHVRNKSELVGNLYKNFPKDKPTKG